MKQSDIAMLVLIVSISLLVSYFVGNSLFAGDSNRVAEVPTAQSISADFPQPSPDVFNEKAVNLTETITVTDNNSDKPFTSGDE
jgi:hypothetical protein